MGRKFGWHSGKLICNDLDVQRTINLGTLDFGAAELDSIVIKGRLSTSTLAGAALELGSGYAYGEGAELRYKVTNWTGIGSSFKALYLRSEATLGGAYGLRGAEFYSVMNTSTTTGLSSLQNIYAEMLVKASSSNRTLTDAHCIEANISVENQTGTLTLTNNIYCLYAKAQTGTGINDYTKINGIRISGRDDGTARVFGNALDICNPEATVCSWTKGINITTSCTTGISLSTGTFTTGISLGGTLATGITIGASTTGLLISGATTTGISITGNSTDAIKIATGTITDGIDIAVGCATAGINFSAAQLNCIKSVYNISSQLGQYVQGLKIEHTRSADIQPSTGGWWGMQVVLNAGSYTELDKPCYVIHGVMKGSGGSSTEGNVARFETQSDGKVEDLLFVSANSGSTVAGDVARFVAHVAPTRSILALQNGTVGSTPVGLYIDADETMTTAIKIDNGAVITNAFEIASASNAPYSATDISGFTEQGHLVVKVGDQTYGIPLYSTS